MQSTRGKSVLWQPGSNRFVVGGGSELRTFDWEQDPSSSMRNRWSSTSVITELTGLRSFAWSPQLDKPFLAAGLSTGRVLLCELGEASGRRKTGGDSATTMQINVRNARTCTSLAFSQVQHNYLAVGLEKGRGESLLVFDISHSMSAPAAGASAHRPHPLSRKKSQGELTSGTPSASSDIAPLLSFGASESVTSASFLTPSAASSSSLLAAAMSNKFLRVYDIRSPPSTVATFNTRAVFGIASNPFNAQQFSSFGDDGIVRVWDLRKPMDPLISFSDADAGAVSTGRKQRSNSVPKPLVETAWSTDQRGVFATLEKDAFAPRVWRLADGPGPRLIGGLDGGGVHGRAGVPSSHVYGSRSTGQEDGPEVLRTPVVLEDMKTRPFQQPLTSFAFAPSSTSRNSSCLRFLGVSRDSSSPGCSGHLLDSFEVEASPHVGFLERGLVLSATTTLSPLTFDVPPSTVEDADEEDERNVTTLASPARTSLALHSTSPPDRGRSLSLAGFPPLLVDRDQTPRPSGPIRRISGGAMLQIPNEATATEDLPRQPQLWARSSLSGLSSDISVLLRERIEAGYGSDASVNATLSDGSVKEFWLWVARAQTLSADACFADYDFRFRGVLRILQGFPSGMTNPALHSPVATPTSDCSPRTSSPRSIYSDISRSLRRGEEALTKNAAYAAACAELVARKKLGTFAISSSEFAAQRKIALASCGAEWEEGWEEVCSRLQKHGQYEDAARHALFSGQLERLMLYLRMCKDENLRMLAPIVAAYLAQRDTNQSSESPFTSLCRTLSSDVETPWIRAMFAYLATSDWRELLDETGLPLKDRVAVALRFLSDSELIPFLQDLGEEALSSSDLEAVVLFGLRNDGLKLLSSFVDRTSDVQTVALACSFTSPGLIRADIRVKRWVETYRSQLDQFQLYAARAMFDASRGKRARTAIEQAKVAGRNGEAKEVAEALRRAAPPQILLRCQFCGTKISPAGKKGSGLGSVERNGGDQAGKRSTVCPSCSKQLPACCICLSRPSVHAFDTNGPSTLCWCQRCRHGGHVEHILAWFDTSTVCAVAGCDCECSSNQP
ncbi:hypothetical protein JCM11641_005912 [Rhodosporidiobolus odoratus]